MKNYRNKYYYNHNQRTKKPLEQEIYQNMIKDCFHLYKTPKPLKSISFTDRKNVAKILLNYYKIYDFRQQYKNKSMSSKAQYSYNNQVKTLKRLYGYLSKDSQNKMKQIKDSINNHAQKSANSQMLFDKANNVTNPNTLKKDKQDAYQIDIANTNHSLNKYFNTHYIPAFLVHTPKKDRFNYASYISQQSYLDYLRHSTRHVSQDNLLRIKYNTQDTLAKLPKHEQMSVTRFHANKPKVFSNLHFKAMDYISNPFNKDIHYYKNRLYHNIDTAIPLISKAKHPLIMSKLLMDYTNSQDKESGLNKLAKKYQPYERNLYNHLDNTEKVNFVKSLKQWKTPEALQIVNESATNVMNPSIKTQPNHNIDTHDALDTVHDMNLKHTLQKHNMPTSLKVWVLRRFEKQINQHVSPNTPSGIKYEPKSIQDSVNAANHIYNDRKNILASKRDQAKHGDLSQMLAGVGEEVKNTKKKQMKRQHWSDMDSKNRKQDTQSIQNKPTAQHKLSNKQRLLKQNQQGKSIK